MTPFKNHKQLSVIVLIFCFAANYSLAQGVTITKYFDADWNKTSKDAAFFYTEMVKGDGLYKYTSYWMKSKRLNCRATYADTAFTKPVGVLLRYYENGQTQDSTYFDEDDNYKNTYHYYDNGRLWVHYTYDSKSKREATDAYEANGKRIADFIFSKEASFQDGITDWQNFIGENIKTDVPGKKGAHIGTYQVIIDFVVGKNGRVTDVKAETNQGFGMEEEAIRVIKKSPKWNPAILMGKTVNAYRRQPVTFLVKD